LVHGGVARFAQLLAPIGGVGDRMPRCRQQHAVDDGARDLRIGGFPGAMRRNLGAQNLNFTRVAQVDPV